MTITEQQRWTLSVMAESAGWGWADVEAMAFDLFREPVAGLTEAQARRLTSQIEFWTNAEADGATAVSPAEIEPGVFCELCIRCGEQCTPSPNDALCYRCAREADDAGA